MSTKLRATSTTIYVKHTHAKSSVHETQSVGIRLEQHPQRYCHHLQVFASTVRVNGGRPGSDIIHNRSLKPRNHEVQPLLQNMVLVQSAQPVVYNALVTRLHRNHRVIHSPRSYTDKYQKSKRSRNVRRRSTTRSRSGGTTFRYARTDSVEYVLQVVHCARNDGVSRSDQLLQKKSRSLTADGDGSGRCPLSFFRNGMMGMNITTNTLVGPRFIPLSRKQMDLQHDSH
jgi:hypothetical protein